MAGPGEAPARAVGGRAAGSILLLSRKSGVTSGYASKIGSHASGPGGSFAAASIISSRVGLGSLPSERDLLQIRVLRVVGRGAIWSWADVRGTAAILRSEIHAHREPWLFRSPVFGSGVRRLDGEAIGDRRLARTLPRRVARWLAASTIAPPAPASDRGALFTRGCLPSPSRFVFRPQNRGAVIQALPAAS